MSSSNPGIAAHLRYAFHNSLTAGTVALIGWLAVISLALIGLAAIVVSLLGIAPPQAEGYSFFEAFWLSLMRTLDAGTMGADEGWTFRFTMLGVTLGGIFIVSTLIGILTSGIENQIGELRKGRSLVIERDHTLILGWSSKIYTVISEIALANESRTRPRIVILADRDKVEMDDDIRSKVPALGKTRVICRSGSPVDLDDLRIVNPWEARSIIVLSPDEDDGDVTVIKAILALTNHPDRPESANPTTVAELRGMRNLETARLAGKGRVELVVSSDLIARITVQTCRQSGLSVVLTELLDFGGDEISFRDEPGLAGKTFSDTLLAYDSSSVIGIAPASGGALVNPPMDRVLEAGDRLIVIAEDDSVIRLAAATPAVDTAAIVRPNELAPPPPERTLILGWNERAPFIIREMDQYVPDGSGVHVVSDVADVEAILQEQVGPLRHTALTTQNADTTDRRVLESLIPSGFDHVLVLCATHLGVQAADARTLVTLLHLREIAQRTQSHFGLVTEMLDVRNIDLAKAAHADDFIVSDRLTSLLLSQLSENPELSAVLADLFDADGSEVYLKPVSNYVEPNREVTFATVVHAARDRNEVAIGYRRASDGNDAGKSFGVVVNPDKLDRVRFSADDRVVVISEN